MTFKIWKVTLFLSAFLFSLSQDMEITSGKVVFDPPESFPEPFYTSEKFPFSKERVQLGKSYFTIQSFPSIIQSLVVVVMHNHMHFQIIIQH